MKAPKKDRYEKDADGLLREIVSEHAKDKHQLLRTYVELSSHARKRYREKGGRTAYVELYCGTGRVRLRESREVADGSAVLVAKTAIAEAAPFDTVIVSDSDPGHAEACRTRLEAQGVGGVTKLTGKAHETVDDAIAKLPANALTQVLLDPYSLKALPFSTIERLAALPHVDIVVHFSTYDMNRNLETYLPTRCASCPSDWRSRCSVGRRHCTSSIR